MSPSYTADRMGKPWDRWHNVVQSSQIVHQGKEASCQGRARALEVDVVASEPAFLPDLQSILGNPLSIHVDCNLFASFINTRQAAGRPVHLSYL